MTSQVAISGLAPDTGDLNLDSLIEISVPSGPGYISRRRAVRDVAQAAGVIGVDIQAYSPELTDIAAIATYGFLVRDATATWITRSIVGTANEITVTNGDGIAGAPVLSLPAGLTLSGKTLTGGSITPQAAPTTTAIGYLGVPQNIQNANYTTVMADTGKHLYHTSGTAHTWTIDSNANVAYPIGTILTFINENGAGVITLAVTTDTLRWGSSAGPRSLAANATVTAVKVTAGTWRLTGDGIS